jgi:hypothetical protein
LGACHPGGLRRQHQTYFRLYDRASAVPKGKAGPDSLASQQRHFLPKDLAGALKRLDDVEIDALLAAVTTEAERRGRRPPNLAKRSQQLMQSRSDARRLPSKARVH